MPPYAAFHLGLHCLPKYLFTITQNEKVELCRTLSFCFFTEFLTRSSPELHLYFERIPIADIPLDHNELQNWMYKRFQHKDK